MITHFSIKKVTKNSKNYLAPKEMNTQDIIFVED